MPAFEDVVPIADHWICVRNLYTNYRDEGYRGVALNDKTAAFAYTEVEFNAHMEQLKRMNGEAFEYLNKIDLSGWSRASFNDYPQCDLLMKNICECFNSCIPKACNMPILTMLEMIRKNL
jgi:hypothetical protein